MAQTPTSPGETSQIAESSSQITEYGYYIMIDNLFYSIDPYPIKIEFGFNKLGDLKYIPADKDFKVIVHRPKWHYEHTSFFAQDLDIVNHDYTNRIEPKIAQVGEHVFELEFPALKKGQLLIINDYNNLYGIGIGSISDTLIELFNTTKAPAHAVLDNIKKAMKSFPGNIQIESLKAVWEEKAVEEKSEKVWKDVQEKLEEYNAREDREGKLIFADDVLYQIQYYLSLGDNLPRKGEAEKITVEIEAFKNDKPEVVKEPLPSMDQLADNIVSYQGDSFTLNVVEVGDDVLLRFKGIPNEYDGVVLRHKKSIQNEATGAYIMQTNEIKGEENWNTISYENDGWGGESLYAFPPSINNKVYLYVTDNDNDDTPMKLYKDYAKNN